MEINSLINKAATLERCIQRIKEEYEGHEGVFETNFTKQDSILLNLERLCQAAIDMGVGFIKIEKLDVPQEYKQIFQILEKNGFISKKLSYHLQGMVGFRNLAVHDYQKLNLDIVRNIIQNRLLDFEAFSSILLGHLTKKQNKR